MSDSLVLAVESSCDETGAAVVRGREVLANVVASQERLHAPFGGVVPEVAARRHLEMVDATIAEALHRAGCDRPDVVAVTRGPGLIGALLVGLAAAKARAWGWGVPLIAVDHLVGHVASALLAGPEVEPPFSCLLVSGGHTLALRVGPGLELTLLGTSRDDAAGEAFDKGARLLGLGLPGGPAIERVAAGGDPAAVRFTPAMVHHDTLDTSFSGIKTALAVELDSRRGPLGEGEVADLAASYQVAIVETLAACARKLVRQEPGRPLVLVGGVAANALLRSEIERICAENDVNLFAAPLRYCADNAAMIGVAAGYCTPLNPAELRHIDAYASSPLFRTGNVLPMDQP